MPKKPSKFFKHLIDLREGMDDKKVVLENVRDDADFNSVRFWTLVSAVGVASVGLNINSIPVIIGAMLISPLMGPIVSVGVSLTIYDWEFMRRSFRNFLILTLIGIIISTIYFALSPINNAQSELLARTQPTLFDVLIAIFGGTAAFIGISRMRANTVVPGVAIATALMPPLCTIGYGIATLQMTFIFGASYLYLINSIFICLSVLLVAKYMRLPKQEYPDETTKKRVSRVITAVIIIMVVPAIYLAYTFVQQNNFNQNANAYIAQEFEAQGYVVIYKDLQFGAQKKIDIAVLDENFDETDIAVLKAKLPQYGLSGVGLEIRQNGFSLTEEEWLEMLTQLNGEEEKRAALEARILSERATFMSPSRLLSEAKSFNSKIEDIAIGTLNYGSIENELTEPKQTVTVYSTEPLMQVEANMMHAWLRSRLKTDELTVHFVPDVFPEVSIEDETLE